MELKQEADESGMSVSEYLEAIVENRHVKDDIQMLRYDLQTAKSQRDLLAEKTRMYDGKVLPIFNKYKGRTLPFRNEAGVMAEKVIHTPVDMLEVIISSISNSHNGTN